MPYPRAILALLLFTAAACSEPGASGGTGGSDAGHPCTSGGVACCPTDSMVDLYPGQYANQPYDPKAPADACIAAPHDVIIVLGCPNNADGTPSDCQTKRADIAVALSQAGFGTQFITSGAAVHNQYVEADTLRDLLLSRGIPATSITTEPQAQHTDENIYYSTQIMAAHDWKSALVVSDDPGHLILTTLCDTNCCVDLGRLTVFEFPTPKGTYLAGHYALYPWATPVTPPECTQIEQPSKFMCTNLPTRKACAANFQL